MEDIVEVVTATIFQASVQHAAVNFKQYEQYSFPIVYPSMLNGNPPTSKVDNILVRPTPQCPIYGAEISSVFFHVTLYVSWDFADNVLYQVDLFGPFICWMLCRG